MDKLLKHLGKLVVGALVTLVFSGFAYVGSTWEERLHQRITVLESNSERLIRVEQKLDDLITEVRRATRGTVSNKEKNP